MTRIVRHALLLACLATVFPWPGISLSASSGIAYVDFGTDPEEGVPLDVRASRRWVRHTEEGRRLVVTVRTYEGVGQGYHFKITLDSRGGHLPDFYLFVDDTGGPRGASCDVHKYSTKKVVAPCELRANDSVTVVRARVAARDVRPDKHIRWWVFAPPLYDDTTDRAPDQGWYG
jgi:hypothetical protein